MNAATTTYDIELEGQAGRTWLAEISINNGNIERSFLKGTYLNKPGASYKRVIFEMKKGKIYEACEGSRAKLYKKIMLNNEIYRSIKEAQSALPQTPYSIPSQSEINKLAWAKARKLNGGDRKGSKKFLSQAFKYVWVEIKAGV